MFRPWWIAVACLASLFMVGCQDAPPPAAQTGTETTGTPGEDGAPVAKSPGQEAVKPALPVLENVDSFEGNWVLAPHISRRNVHFWLFRLTPGDNGEWSAETLTNEPLLGKIQADKVEIDGQKIRITARILNEKAQIKDSEMSFEGTLRDGKVSGNLLFAETGGLAPARLIPTDADTLTDYQDSTASEGAVEFDKALREPDPARGLLKVAQSMPDSPATLEAYSMIFNGIVRWNLTEDEVQTAAAGYNAALERWGPRLQAFSEINAGMQLALARKHVDLADQFLNAGEARVPDQKTAAAQLKAGRLNVRIARALHGLGGKDEEAAAKAYAEAQELLITLPYQPELLWSTAEYAEKHEKTDEAIAYYRTIVALPMLERMAVSTRIGLVAGDELPHMSLEKLWKAKEGTEETLKAAVAETYTQQVGELFAKLKETDAEFPAVDAGNRIVLAEVFTGTACEACVAADLAVELLHDNLPSTELVVLNYHNHVPGPDPLTSLDSEERATFYQVQGTPAVFVNGAPIPNVGGFFMPEMIEDSYKRIRMGVDFFLKTSTEIVITATAEAAEGNLAVNVAVEGILEKELSNVRLRLAIVEENVPLNAPNGIRKHPMVVRTMLGGPKGISAKQGALKYSLQKMPLAELKARQLGYLRSFEEGKRIKFSKKPADLKPLFLAAFVQNEMTREVLQAVLVPVTGELVYPEINFDPPAEKPAGDQPAETPTPDKNPTDSATEKTEGGESKPETPKSETETTSPSTPK